MTEKYILVEHFSTINTVIHNTFHSTQRIKFTAFDVSTKYIVFGVKSGGVYIFNRDSCQFLKLIPSTHGSANLLSISEDETNLAIAVCTGLVIILENCFDSTSEQHVFCEHEGGTVTAMKWNDNDLYCGDSKGRVSVITLKSFLMFQSPVACLMHLESPIVQLDTHSKFLLVSTMTRSLLCDTETERYSQIGKKSRDGSFGACFLNVVDSIDRGVTPHARGTFQNVAEHEELSSSQVDDNVKIYCARPGARLWQADFQANVVYTHQFRQSLNQKETDTIYWDDSIEFDLRIKKPSDDSIQNFNFSKIFRFLNKFVLTFKDDGFYIFEPSSSALLFWKSFPNIKDLKIVNSSIYIWHRDFEVSIMSLLSVEELILKSLYKKQYVFCGQLCVRFFDEVSSSIGTSNKIHLISILESKLDNCELLDKLSPIFQRLKDCSKTPTLEKFKNGIVNVTLPEHVENFQCAELKTHHNVILEQYRVYKIHKNLETNDFKQLMSSLNDNEIYNLISNLDDSDCQFWCKEIFLEFLKTPEDLDPEVLKYACDAFLSTNDSRHLACKCKFPLPKACKNVPKHYQIGCELMVKSGNYEIFLQNVPYMNRYVLEKIHDLEEVQLKIPLIVQYSDSEIIKLLLDKMPYDIWDESLHLFAKLKTGCCLHCGEKIDSSDTIQWRDFAILMVHSIKATNALKLLKRYANLLPKGGLDEFFYQYCIFSSVTDLNTVGFTKILNNELVQKQFESSVGGYLYRRYLHGGDYDPSKKSESIRDCDHCHLPLKTPIIEETRKLNCGHCFHKVCFLYNDSRCPICSPVF